MSGTIVYDAGALIGAERRNPRLIALHDELTRAKIRPTVPAAVLAQVWRGGPQPLLSRALRGCDILPDDEHLARAAGVACAKAGTSDVVDAIVIAVAVRQNAAIVTSDPDDLARLAAAVGVPVRFFVV